MVKKTASNVITRKGLISDQATQVALDGQTLLLIEGRFYSTDGQIWLPLDKLPNLGNLEFIGML